MLKTYFSVSIIFFKKILIIENYVFNSMKTTNYLNKIIIYGYGYIYSPILLPLIFKSCSLSYTMPRAGWWGFAALIEGDQLIPNPEGQQVPVELGAIIWVCTVNMQ